MVPRINAPSSRGVLFFWRNNMNIVLEYIIVFIVVYILCYIILLTNKKSYKNKRTPDIFYLQKIYNIKIKSTVYKKYIYVFALINAFIIDTTYILIVYLLHNLILRIILGIIILILLTIICYGLFARYYLWKEGNDDV